RAARCPFDHRERRRPLELIAVELRRPFAVERVLVALDLDVVAAGLGVVVHPVDDRRMRADEVEVVRVEIEEDPVADHVAVVVDRDELLRRLGAEAREVVDTETLEEPQGVGAAHEEIRRVVRLVEQRARLPPRALLGAPVAELRRHREGVRPRCGVAQQLDGATDTLDRMLETLVAHWTVPPSVSDCSAAVTLAMCLRIARSAARASPAAIASAIARCSANELSDRPGARIVRYWKRTICAWRDEISRSAVSCRAIATMRRWNAAFASDAASRSPRSSCLRCAARSARSAAASFGVMCSAARLAVSPSSTSRAWRISIARGSEIMLTRAPRFHSRSTRCSCSRRTSAVRIAARPTPSSSTRSASISRWFGCSRPETIASCSMR